MQIGDDVFGSSKPILSIDTDSYVIIPNTVTFQDLDSEIDYSLSDENRVAGIEYSYHGMYVGNAYLNLATDNASTYEFDANMTSSDVSVEKVEPEAKQEQSQDTIFINIKKVLLGILILAAVVIAIFMIHALIANGRTAKRRNNRVKRKQRRRSSIRTDFDDFDF